MFCGFGVAEIHLGTISKNHAFYVVLGFRGGPGTEKNDMLKVFQHSSAKFVDMMGRHRAKIGPT